MPRVQRSADVTWKGNVARGSGGITAATGAFEQLPYSLATRVEAPDGHTSPEELLAAAHAACYAMSLASELAKAGNPPERLEVAATCVMDEVGDRHLVVASQLEVGAEVPGLGDEAFQAAVRAADEGCPISALIRASAEIRISASLH